MVGAYAKTAYFTRQLGEGKGGTKVFLLGTLVNAVAVVIGSFIGWRLHRIPDRLKSTVLHGMGLFTIALGISMAIQGLSDALYIVLAIVIGGVLGSWWDIEGHLDQLGCMIERRLGGGKQGISRGFVFATLIFCVGSMAIVGSIQSGMSGQNNILFTKSVMDGFSSIIFTSTLGIGVGLAAIPIFLYQGMIATLAHIFGNYLNSPVLITDLTATGGILILGIGMNIMEVKKIQVANLLPSLVVVISLHWMVSHLAPWISHIV